MRAWTGSATDHSLYPPSLSSGRESQQTRDPTETKTEIVNRAAKRGVAAAAYYRVLHAPLSPPDRGARCEMWRGTCAPSPCCCGTTRMQPTSTEHIHSLPSSSRRSQELFLQLRCSSATPISLHTPNSPSHLPPHSAAAPRLPQDGVAATALHRTPPRARRSTHRFCACAATPPVACREASRCWRRRPLSCRTLADRLTFTSGRILCSRLTFPGRCQSCY